MPALTTLTVVVTKPVENANGLLQALQKEGATTIHHPTIVIHPKTDQNDQQSMRAIKWADCVIFVSQNAVNSALHADKINWPCQIDVCAIGHTTANALQTKGILHVLTPPPPFTSEALLSHPRLNRVDGQRILIVKGEGGRSHLHDTLSKRGAEVQDLAVYMRERGKLMDEAMASRLFTQKTDIAIVSTSCETIDNLLTITPEPYRKQLKSLPHVMISERMLAHAQTLGFTSAILARSSKNEDVVAALIKWRN